MSRDGRERPTELVEVISSDPQRFGTDAPIPEPAKPTTPRRPRLDLAALGGVVLVVVVAIAVAWPRSSGSPTTSPSTSAIERSIAGASPTTVPGREAPVPSARVAFELTVTPSPVVPRAPVVMQLEGDLSGVASPISAVAWVDRQVSGEWRTVYWLARSSATAQSGGNVSNNSLEPSPDAITFGADQPVQFNVDALTSGSYRLCRYVPLRVTDTSIPPSSEPRLCVRSSGRRPCPRQRDRTCDDLIHPAEVRATRAIVVALPRRSGHHAT